MPQTATQPTALDPDAVNLSKAIRQTESGGNFQAKGKSGEYGAYQYTAPTWQADAAKAGINVPLDQATPEQQNQVAYTKIKSLKDQGLNVGQIASVWNSNDPEAYTGKFSLKTKNHNPGDPSIGTNDYNVHFDVPSYAKSVATAYQTIKQGGAASIDPNNPSSTANPQNQPEQPASVGGFLGNTLQSGANFLGNLGEAALHPINTIQNIGGAAVGGLQELGGQTNDNTAKFDALKNYFVNRYKSPDALLHTAYTDPVGLAADISTLFGVGGGAVGAAGKVAKLSGLADTANAVGKVSESLGEASRLTNPLTPVAAGIGGLLNKSKGLSDIIANPKDYSPEEIARASGERISHDVQEAIKASRASHSETGSGYDDIRNAKAPLLQLPEITGGKSIGNTIPLSSGDRPISNFTGTQEPQLGPLSSAAKPTPLSGEAPATVKVTHDFLENQFRTAAKLDVKDGKILPTTTSKVGKPELTKLQDILDTFKPSFQKGELTNDEFLTLRKRLSDAAYNDNGMKNSDLAEIAANIRRNLNTEYRGSISGLEAKDARYTAEEAKINDLEEGVVYKTGSRKGEIKDSFLNSAQKAVKNDDTEKLTQLEEILPGITKRLKVMKTLKDLGSPSFTTSLVEKGGVVGGLLTGNIQGTAVALSSIILSQPEIALPLLRAVGASLPLVKSVMAHLAKSLTVSAVGDSAVNTGTQQPGEISATSQPQETGQAQTTETASSNEDIKDVPGYQAAHEAGYSDDEIRAYLKSQ